MALQNALCAPFNDIQDLWLILNQRLKEQDRILKRNALESSQRATTRIAVKAVLNAIEENNKDSAKEALAKAEKTLDSMAGKK